MDHSNFATLSIDPRVLGVGQHVESAGWFRTLLAGGRDEGRANQAAAITPGLGELHGVQHVCVVLWDIWGTVPPVSAVNQV